MLNLQYNGQNYDFKEEDNNNSFILCAVLKLSLESASQGLIKDLIKEVLNQNKIWQINKDNPIEFSSSIRSLADCLKLNIYFDEQDGGGVILSKLNSAYAFGLTAKNSGYIIFSALSSSFSVTRPSTNAETIKKFLEAAALDAPALPDQHHPAQNSHEVHNPIVTPTTASSPTHEALKLSDRVSNPTAKTEVAKKQFGPKKPKF